MLNDSIEPQAVNNLGLVMPELLSRLVGQPMLEFYQGEWQH